MKLIRPLPRSLAPLPDESLPGFLLRLSHRLDLSPSRVARLTGLTSASVNQLRIPAARAAGIRAPTRLTEAEVAALCLDSLRDRFPQARWDDAMLQHAAWVGDPSLHGDG